MASLPREKLIEHALTLIVQSEVAPGQAAASAKLALARWREKSAEHHAAAHEAHRRWSALGGLAPDLRTHFQDAGPHGRDGAPAGKARQRRKVLLSIAGLLGAGTLLERGAQWYRQQPVFATAYETRTAQMLKAVLPDGPQGAEGSRMDLAPLSAAAVKLYRQRRSISLTHGEARFDVVPDPGRPFEVLTRQARIEVVGTVFTISDRGGPTTIGVERGHVRVLALDAQPGQPPRPRAAPLDLYPGQAVEIREDRPPALRQTDTAALSAWRDGWLVFENAPLAEALATINAYRARPIEATDSRVGSLRLTGRFRASDSAGLVAVLPAILPLAVDAQADGGVKLRMR